MPSPIRDSSELLAQDRVYLILKEAITSARLKPGQRLRSDMLAQLVNASRTPVREALGRLAQVGLVERDDGWGYVVRQVGVRDTLELYSLREALEMHAIRELVPKLTPKLVGQLQTLFTSAEDLFVTERYDAFLVKIRAFHNALARASDNGLLQQMLGMIDDRVRQIGALIVERDQSSAREIMIETRRIMTAIRKRDLNLALAAVQDHVRRGRDRFLRLLGGPVPLPARGRSKSSPKHSPLLAGDGVPSVSIR